MKSGEQQTDGANLLKRCPCSGQRTSLAQKALELSRHMAEKSAWQGLPSWGIIRFSIRWMAR